MIQPPKIKSVNRFGSKTDPIKTAGFLASEQQKASEKAPRIGDVIASIGGQAKEALGEKPRGWRALASGISQGVENAGKLSSIFDRKQDMEKYNQVMNYLQETNNAAIKEKQWYEKIEAASLKYAPQVLSYLKNSNQYDIQTADDIVDNLFSGWNRETGQNWVKQGLHPTDRNLVFASDGADGPIQLLDMRDLFAGNDLLQNELAASSSSYQLQLQDERKKLAMQEELNNAKIAKYQAEVSNLPLKGERERSKSDIQTARVQEQGYKRIQAAQEKYGPKIQAAARVKVIVDKMRPLVEKYPKALQSISNIVWSNEDHGVITAALQKLAQKADLKKNPEEAQAIAQLGKYSNELKIAVISGLSKPNMAVDRMAAGSIPGQHMPPKAFLKILDDIEKTASYDRELYINKLKSLPPVYGQENQNYAQDYEEYVDRYTAPQIQNDMVPVIINGQKGSVSKEDYEILNAQ